MRVNFAAAAVHAACASLLFLSGCARLADSGAALPTFAREVPSHVEPVKPIHPQRWTLPNGLQVLFLENDELPLVSGTLFLKFGTLWENPARPGAMSMMGDQMRAGGAGSRSPDVLDEDLEKLAASVSSSMGEELGSVSFSCLSGDFEKVFGIYADVALRPRFAPERLALAKGQALEGIRRRVDDPGTIAPLSFRQLLFGDTPYGNVLDAEDIQRIGREDLLSEYARAVRPDGAYLAITGKVDVDTLKREVEKRFADWKPRGTPRPAPPAVNFTPKPGIYFVNGPFTQATFVVGQQGIPRLTPDYPAIEVFNFIFGMGGFSARLMDRVRADLGLAYGIYGMIAAGPVKGKTFFSAQTKADSTDEAIIESLKVLAGMQQAPVPAEELRAAKNSIDNSFVFKFDTPGEALSRLVTHELLDFPPDFDEVHLDRVNAVSAAEVEEVAKTRWDPSQFVILVVGNDRANARIENLLKGGNPEVPAVLAKMPLYHARFDQKLIVNGSVPR